MIPEGWIETTIEEIGAKEKYAIVDGPFGSNLKSEHYQSSGIPVIQSGFVTTNRFVPRDYVYVSEKLYKEQRRSSVIPGDIIMAKIGAKCGTCAIMPARHPVSILAGNCLKITTDTNLCLNLYLLELLHWQYDKTQFVGVKTETAQPAISLSNLRALPILLPPLAEQRKIAAILSTWDEAITRTTQLIAALQRRKQALMQLLLTGAVRLPGFEDSEWEELPLNELVDPVSRTESVNPESEYKLIGVRLYVAGVHIHEVMQGNQIITSSLSKIQKQDIVYNKMWTTKAAFGIAKDAHDGAYGTSEYPQFVAKQNKLETNYLEYVFHDPTFQYQATTLCRGSTGRARLNPSDFLKIIIDIPVISEQRKIAGFLQSCDEEIATYSNHLLHLQAQKRGLMQQLLTGAVRVSLSATP